MMKARWGVNVHFVGKGMFYFVRKEKLKEGIRILALKKAYSLNLIGILFQKKIGKL